MSRKSGAHISDVTVQVLIMVGLLVLMVVTAGLVNERFFSPIVLRGTTREIAILTIFAIGQGVLIISGGIDLSVGSMICLTGTMLLLLLNNPEFSLELPLLGPFQLSNPTCDSVLAAAVVVLLVAAALGLMHGLLVCWLKLQPFLVTLCSLLVYRSVARSMTGDSTVAFDPMKFPLLEHIGRGSWLGIPMPIYIALAIIVPVLVFMHATVPGRYLYAIGYNAEAARFSGVPVNLLRVFTFVLCAVLAGVAGILEAGSLGSRTPSSAGMLYELYAVTAAVLGGCSFRGGEGSILGIVVGAAVLKVILPLVIFFGVSTFLTDAVTGGILLGAVVVDAVVRRQRAR